MTPTKGHKREPEDKTHFVDVFRLVLGKNACVSTANFHCLLIRANARFSVLPNLNSTLGLAFTCCYSFVSEISLSRRIESSRLRLMSQYQLPCENCGQIIPVSVTMAGRALACPHCGHGMTAPKLGAIRNLPPIVSETPTTTYKRRWTAESGLLFSGGFALLVIGLAGFFVSYRSYMIPYTEVAKSIEQLPTKEMPDYSDLTQFEERAASLTVEQLWNDWRLGLKQNLNEWKPVRIRAWLDEMDDIYRYMVGFGITAGLGFVACVSSFFFTRRSPVQAR